MLIRRKFYEDSLSFLFFLFFSVLTGNGCERTLFICLWSIVCSAALEINEAH